MFIRYMELKLSKKEYVGSMLVIVSFIISCMAISLTFSMFCSLGSLNASLMSLSLLYIPYLATSLGLSGLFG